jgi:hypothetical protein
LSVNAQQRGVERSSGKNQPLTSRAPYKDLKIGFGMEYAVFFAIGALTYNLNLGFRGIALVQGWERSQLQTVRWRLFQTAGKIVRPTGGFEDQRRHAGCICCDPRALRALHAGRRSCSRNILTPGAAFSRSWTRKHKPPEAEPRPKRSKTPAPDAEVAIGKLGEALGLATRCKMG